MTINLFTQKYAHGRTFISIGTHLFDWIPVIFMIIIYICQWWKDWTKTTAMASWSSNKRYLDVKELSNEAAQLKEQWSKIIMIKLIVHTKRRTGWKGRCACDTNRINANWIVQMRNLPIIHSFDSVSWPIGARNASEHSPFTDECWFPLILHRFDLRRALINFKNEKCAYK